MTCSLHTQTWKDCASCAANAAELYLERAILESDGKGPSVAEVAYGMTQKFGFDAFPEQRTHKELPSERAQRIFGLTDDDIAKARYTENAQQGWQCPACKTCHAPFVRSCERCSEHQPKPVGIGAI